MSGGAGRVLATIGIGVVLYVGHAAFAPVALAMLCALILSGPVESLRRLNVPRGLSAAVILVLALAFAAGVLGLVWVPAQRWLERAPTEVEVIKRKLSPLTNFVMHVEDLRSSARTLGRETLEPGVPAAVATESAPLLLFNATRQAVIATLAFIVVTLSLLAGGPPMLARMTAALVRDVNAGRVMVLIEAVRSEVGRFYVTTSFINLGLGAATAGAMALCGMPNPMLWGTLAAAFNFIPYAGSAATLVIVGLVALASFESLGRILAVVGSYLLLSTLAGQVVQPWLVGRRLQVNPLLIFLALWFFGIFWGITGIILSTPILVACKVIAEHVEGGAALVKFLSPHQPLLLAKLRRL